MNAKDEHLDPLELDALRAGEGPDTARAHLERCAECRAGLAGLERLAAEVRSQAAPRLAVPEEIDRAVLAMARERLSSPQPAGRSDAARPAGRARVLRFPLAARIAAAVLLAFALGFWIARDTWFGGGAREVARGPGGARAVDIVDAYVLALRIRSGAALGPALDSNGDGLVDGKDVDELARRSVSISGRGRP